MKDGIVSGTLPQDYLYAAPISYAATSHLTSVFLAYAIALNETIEGEKAGLWNAATVVSPDGGHGLFQLTSLIPYNWNDPLTNASWACEDYIVPAWAYWANAPYHLQGDDLVRAIAAEFNAGRGNAINGHREGDVGKYTTFSDGKSYADRALAHYQALCKLGNS